MKFRNLKIDFFLSSYKYLQKQKLYIKVYEVYLNTFYLEFNEIEND